jgi:hypothetical protein
LAQDHEASVSKIFFPYREKPDENKERVCIGPYHENGYDEGNDHACEEREIEEFRSGPYE